MRNAVAFSLVVPRKRR
jgi:PadR family transcriptional regulator, regulatory protein PadR